MSNWITIVIDNADLCYRYSYFILIIYKENLM